MTDPAQLPFLLRLFDDSSPLVRDKVRAALLAFGPQLETELARQGLTLSPEQAAFCAAAGAVSGDAAFRRAWNHWIDERLRSDETAHVPHDGPRFLEEALELLARWQNGHFDTEAHDSGQSSLSLALDALAAQFRRGGKETNGENLAAFLFSQNGLALRGAPPESYYEPLNSNLLAVLQRRRGLPISLACLFILIGNRLGLVVEGCNFPGHFLARVYESGDYSFYDCFAGGRRLKPHEVSAMRIAEPHAMNAAPPSVVIVARTLRNLVVAFENNGALDKARFTLELLAELEHAANSSR